MFLRLIIFSVLAFFGTPANAQEPFNFPITEKLGQDRHWVHAYTANFGYEEGVPACVAFGGYRSGTYLIIARQIGGQWVMAAANPGWDQIQQGNQYDIVFEFDQRGRSTGSAQGFFSELGNGFIIGTDLTFTEWLAGARGLSLQIEGKSVDSFDLSGSRAAVEAVRNCFDIRLNRPVQTNVTLTSKNQDLNADALQKDIGELEKSIIELEGKTKSKPEQKAVLPDEFVGHWSQHAHCQWPLKIKKNGFDAVDFRCTLRNITKDPLEGTFYAFDCTKLVNDNNPIPEAFQNGGWKLDRNQLSIWLAGETFTYTKC